MRVNNSFALALIATVNTLGGCVSTGMDNSTAADRNTADCQRSSASNQECDAAKTAEGAGTAVTPH